MNDPEHKLDLIPLDYASPATLPGRPFAAAAVLLLGIAMGFAGALLMIYALLDAAYLVSQHIPRRDIPVSILELGMHIAISAICIRASLRWSRSGLRLMHDR